MTAQIGDIIRKGQEEYQVIALTSALPFRPEDYGLKPRYICTGCWRGYWCEYEIQADELCLQTLNIHTAENVYPDINGVAPLPQKQAEFDAHSRRKRKQPVSIPDNLGHRKYQGLGMPVSYSGKILAGNGIIESYVNNMSFQHMSAYKTILEFVFEEGLLLDTIDRSEDGEKMRRYLGDRTHDSKDASRFVEESFSLDYSVKGMWTYR